MADDTQPVTYLTLDQILGADDLEERDVPIEAWGGTVRVRALSRASIRRIYQQATDRKGVIDSEAVERALITQAMVKPIVSPAAYARLDEKRAGAVSQIVNAILDLTGISPDAMDKAQDSFRTES